MHFGVYVQNFGEYGNPHNLLALALDAEQAGWDGFFIWDHLLLYRRSDIPFVDAWVMLGAIAARTERLRLGPMITPVARRRPWKLAREVVSLDHLSRGRAILGVGLGAPRIQSLNALAKIHRTLFARRSLTRRCQFWTVSGVVRLSTIMANTSISRMSNSFREPSRLHARRFGSRDSGLTSRLCVGQRVGTAYFP